MMRAATSTTIPNSGKTSTRRPAVAVVKKLQASFLLAMGLFCLWSNLAFDTRLIIPQVDRWEETSLMLPNIHNWNISSNTASNTSASSTTSSTKQQQHSKNSRPTIVENISPRHHRQQRRKKARPFFRRYHQVPTEVQQAVESILHNSQTSHSRVDNTTIIHMHDSHHHQHPTHHHHTKHHHPKQQSWLNNPPICKETCCARQVAIPMDHEERQLLNTMDGLDLADLLFQFKPSPSHLTFAGARYHEDLLPCLQPGTVIHLNNKNYINSYFWNHIRPQIKVPFVLITSDSDFDSPLVYNEEDYGNRVQNDTLLLKWYGGNPNYYSSGRYSSSNKFEPLPLGLSKRFPQAKHLEPYLALNDYANPFPERFREYNSKHKNENGTVVDAEFDWDRDVFVFFGTKRKRKKLWNRLCGHQSRQRTGNATTATNDSSSSSSRYLSCNSTARVSPHDIYEQASRYKFGISPPGMGWDCFRTYEWLYLGVIPVIEERDPDSHRLFQGLPVVQVPNLFQASRTTITRHIQDFLKTTDARKEDYRRNGIANPALAAPGWRKLFLAYWRRKIWKDAGRQLLKHNGREYYVSWKYESTKGNEGIYCAPKGNCGRE